MPARKSASERRSLRRALRPRAADAGLVLLVLLVDVVLWLPNNGTRWGGPSLVVVADVVAACAACSLLWRRRWPLVVHVLCCVSGLAPLLAPGHEPFAAMSVALFTVASRCHLRVSLVAMVLALIPLGVNSYNVVYVDGNRSLSGLLAVTTVWSLIGVFAFGTGRFVYLVRERAELQRREHDLRSAAALTRERLWLARDLHDVVANSVGAMIVQTGVARALVTAETNETVERLRTIEATGLQAMKELHGLLALLRSAHDASRPPVAGEPTEPVSVLAERLIAEAQTCGVLVTLTRRGAPIPLDPPVEQCARRVLQECLANVIKHGGAEPRSTVELSWSPGSLSLIIWNDARSGADTALASSGFGLLGIQERVAELGGSLEAGPEGDGYRVRVLLPVREGTPSPSPETSRSTRPDAVGVPRG